MEIKPIKSARDDQRALKETEGLMRARRNTRQGEVQVREQASFEARRQRVRPEVAGPMTSFAPSASG